MQVTIEDAYREACTALGEALVQQRLLAAELTRRDQKPEQVPDESPEQRQLLNEARRDGRHEPLQPEEN